MTLYRAILAGGLCAVTLANAASVGGPVSGAVFDSRSNSIRLVTGVVGSFLLGKTLVDQIEKAEVAPNGLVALAVKGGQLYAVTELQSASPGWILLSPADQGITRIVWSRDSAAAAVYSPSARSVVLVTNISGGSAAQINISLDSLSGEVTAIVLERSGSSLIVGVPGGIYSVTPQGPPVLLASLAQPNAVELIHGDQDLMVADAATLQIFELRDFHGAAELVPFADTSAAVALAASPDGRFLFAADTSCRCIATYEFSTRALSGQIALDPDPAFFKAFSSGRMFLLNSPADSSTTFWMLNASDTPDVFFVSGGVQ